MGSLRNHLSEEEHYVGVSSLQLRAVRGRKERKKKKPQRKSWKNKRGSSLFLLVLMKGDTKCSPAEAGEEMNGGRRDDDFGGSKNTNTFK